MLSSVTLVQLNNQQSEGIPTSKYFDENTSNDENETKNLEETDYVTYRPENTFITIEKALKYSGDNGTYSKISLFVITLFW